MAGLSLCLLVSVGLTTWLVAGSGDDADAPYVARRPAAAAPTVAAGAAGATLGELADALDRRDRTAAAALADPGTGGAAALLAAISDNAAAADLSEIALRYIDELSAVDDDGEWTAAVDAVWRFRGFDQAAARAEVAVRFRSQPDGDVRVVDVGSDQLRTPVWLAGPAHVERTATTVVIASGPVSRLRRYARLARRAVPVVRRVFGSWKPRLVVEVPADLPALDRALGAPVGDYSQIAAVTVSADGSTAPGSPVHVFVNPAVFDGLRGEGAQVVMSHEATHVAADGPMSRAPTWLVEGIADYVALRDVDLPLKVTARQIAERVSADGLPQALPTQADFDTAAPHLGAVYEGAWLLCRTLADRGGERALVRLYDRLSAGEAVAPTLRSLFGWSERQLLGAWQTRLSDLPGVST